MLTFRSLEEFDQDHGTVKLLDTEHSHLYKNKPNSDIILVPQPSDDPNDPLNWPYPKKIVALVTAGLTTGISAWVVGGLTPAVPALAVEFGYDVEAIVNATLNWPTLMLGLGIFLWVPCAGYFGVRPTALVAMTLSFVTCIWSASTDSFRSLEAARVICSIAASCGEVLPALIVKDIFFLHERGRVMGIYLIFFQSMPSLGILTAGFVIAGVGWRWWLWVLSSPVLTIVYGVMLIAVFLFIPETQFPRTSLAQAPSAQLPSRVPQSDKNPKTDVSVTVEDNSVVARKSYLQQLNPWSGINPNGQKASFVSLSLRSWPLIIYPAVAYATVVFGFAVCGILMCIATYSIVFESPPYNMDAGIASLMFLFLAGGAFIGSFYGGLGTDLLSRYLSSKNHGVFEPESRLILLVGPLLLLPSGMIMYAWGCADLAPFPLAWFGVGLCGFSLGSMPAITMAYAVDCYYPVSSEAFFIIVGVKNVIAFGFSYGAIPWIEAWGFKRAIGCVAGITFGLILLGLPLYLFGKQLRFASAKWRLVMW